MENIEKLKNATPDQHKEIARILAKGRRGILLIALKYLSGLFAANMASVFISKYFLNDVDPDMQVGFQIISVILNAIFMGKYFHLHMNKNSATVSKEVETVLNKKEE